MENKRYTVQRAEDRYIYIIDNRTEKINKHIYNEFIEYTPGYNEVTEKYPAYVHREVWKEFETATIDSGLLTESPVYGCVYFEETPSHIYAGTCTNTGMFKQFKMEIDHCCHQGPLSAMLEMIQNAEADNMQILLDGHHGIYIPKILADLINNTVISPGSWNKYEPAVLNAVNDILKSPEDDGETRDDAHSVLLDRAQYTDTTGTKYNLYQGESGDLFLIKDDPTYPEPFTLS